VALKPGSERPDLGAPEEYTHDHPEDHPSDWGWHGEWGRATRIGGWVVVVILILMITTTHYNESGTVSLILFAAAIVAGQLWDIRRKRTSWRK
jgi:hypothetical protein